MREFLNRFVNKLSYLKEVICLPGLLSIICNKSNFSKLLTIFIVGFVSRLLVNYFYSNLHLYFLTTVSILYYISMSAFIILVQEFINYFNLNILPYFSFLYKFVVNVTGYIIKLLINMNQRIFLYKLEDIKISPVIKGVKPSYRPVNSSPLSNPPVTPTNVDEIKLTQRAKFSNKPNSSLRPKNFFLDDPTTSKKTKTSAFLERGKYITKCKEEFKEFYTLYRKSINLSDYELEKLSIKVVATYVNDGSIDDAMDILPNNIRLLYKEFLIKQLKKESGL
jgi:hypothetical protein